MPTGVWAAVAPPGFRRITDESRVLVALEKLLANPAAAAGSPSDTSWKGSVGDWDVTIALTPTGGNLHLDVHAVKSIAGGTIEVHGVGQFDSLANHTSITLANGSTTEIKFDNDGLKGSVDFNWKVAFDADHGGNEAVLQQQSRCGPRLLPCQLRRRPADDGHRGRLSLQRAEAVKQWLDADGKVPGDCIATQGSA